MNVRQHAAGGNGHAPEQLVQFLIILDSQRNVSWDNARLLIVARRIPGEFQNFGRQILQDRGQIDRGPGAHARGVFALAEVAADAPDGKLQAGFGGTRGGLLVAAAAAFALSFACRERESMNA